MEISSFASVACHCALEITRGNVQKFANKIMPYPSPLFILGVPGLLPLLLPAGLTTTRRPPGLWWGGGPSALATFVVDIVP